MIQNTTKHVYIKESDTKYIKNDATCIKHDAKCISNDIECMNTYPVYGIDLYDVR